MTTDGWNMVRIDMVCWLLPFKGAMLLMVYLNPTYWLSHLSMDHCAEGESVFSRLKSSKTDPYLDLGILGGSSVDCSHTQLCALMPLEFCSWLPVSQLLLVATPEQTPGFSLTFNLQNLWQ